MSKQSIVAGLKNFERNCTLRTHEKESASNVSFSSSAILSCMGFHPDITRSWNSPALIRRVSLALLFIGLLATFSWAGDVLKIGSVLANPPLYQSKTVRVTGIVSDDPEVKRFKGWMNNAKKCIQFFTVKDETGSIRVAYEVSCSGAMDVLRKRDRVTLDARFERTAEGAGLLNVVEVLAKIATPAADSYR